MSRMQSIQQPLLSLEPIKRLFQSLGKTLIKIQNFDYIKDFLSKFKTYIQPLLSF